MTLHSTGKVTNKTFVNLEQMKAIMKSFDIKERRCIYENDDILVQHMKADYSNGTKDAIIHVSIKKWTSLANRNRCNFYSGINTKTLAAVGQYFNWEKPIFNSIKFGFSIIWQQLLIEWANADNSFNTTWQSTRTLKHFLEKLFFQVKYRDNIM